MIIRRNGSQVYLTRPIAGQRDRNRASPSRNFETVGKTAYLYYTQFHYPNGVQTLDRDLVRLQVNISPR